MDTIQSNRLRLLESIETALKHGEGVMMIHRMSDKTDHLFSEHLSDPETGLSFPPIEPRLFSFNSPHGACTACLGLGYRLEVDTDLAVNKRLSIREGGIIAWQMVLGTHLQHYYTSLLEAIAKVYNFSLDKPIQIIPDDILYKIMHGFGTEQFSVEMGYGGYKRTSKACFEGVAKSIEKRYNECSGTRLNIYARNVFIGVKTLTDVCKMTIPEAKKWVSGLL